MLISVLLSAALRRPFPIGLLFLLCLLFFVERGAYRGIRHEKSYDFATIYASAGCWSKGINPYENSGLEGDLAEAGAPQSLVEHQEVNPSLYFVSALPLMAMLSWLPWSQALLVWYGLLLILFASSLLMILEQSGLSIQNRWLAASVSLLFCPTYVAFLYGNPAALTASLTALAVCFALKQRFSLAGIALGIATCFKPQTALLGIAVFALWRCWSSIFVAFVISASMVALGAIRLFFTADPWAWWQSQQHNIALVLSVGGKGDPSPSGPWSSELLNGQTLASLFIPNPRLADLCVYLSAAAITLIYLKRRQADRWKDVAFFAAITTTLTYHHYYDGQIFLLLIPLLVQLWKAGDRKTATLLSACVLLLSFPSQTIVPRLLHVDTGFHSWIDIALVRHQPLAVMALTFILAFSGTHTVPFRKPQATYGG